MSMLRSSGRRYGAAVLAVLVLLSAGAALAGRRGERSEEDLTNFLLSPQHSKWLVGAVAKIATGEEVDSYLRLTDDEAATAFIDEFWSRRNTSGSPWPGKRPRDIFARRSEEADKRFSEGTSLGRYSDRGAIHILYGEPEDIDFAEPKRATSGPIEVWRYAKEAEPGLDGASPKRQYYFVKQGDRTVATSAGALAQRTRLGGGGR